MFTLANVMITDQVLAFTDAHNRRVRVPTAAVTSNEIAQLPNEEQARVLRRLARLRESGRRP